MQILSSVLTGVFAGLGFSIIIAAIIFAILPFVAAWRFMKAHRSIANDMKIIIGNLQIE